MQSSGNADVHRIPLLGIDEADLKELGTIALPAESRLELRPRTLGVNMDAATVAVLVPAISSVIVATISAIATIWVAKINSRGKADSEPLRPARPHAVEIETFTTTVLIPIEDGFHTSVESSLPAPRSITAVRFIPGA